MFVCARFVSLTALAVGVGAVLPAQGPPTQWSGPRAGVDLPQTDGVTVIERLEAEVPKDLVLRDHLGRDRRIGEFFDGEHPVILTFNYEDCPMLCSLQLTGFVEGLDGIEGWEVGDEFRVLTVSLDEHESDEQARRFHDKILEGYRGGASATAEEGWAFLRGSAEDVRALADSVGFQYRWIDEKDQYAHPAAVMVLSPEGKVSRYLYGLQFSPKNLRLSLADASDGRFASTLDRIILTCFVFDPDSNSYTLASWTVTRIVLSVIALITLAFLWWLFRYVRPEHSSRTE